jgi:hypothetical protein
MSLIYDNEEHTAIRRTSDGAIIPKDIRNSDYAEIVASGEPIADYVDPRTPQQIWADIRSERDGLLAETDWVVVKAQEVGEAVPAAWVTYRQALRDLPANTADPANPVWPSAP